MDAPPEIYEEQLQLALETRRTREVELAARRDALEQAAQALRSLEEQRLRIEQGLEPLRNRIGELKLKEQAAALNAAQLAEQLEEAGTDESQLQEELQNARPQALSQEIGRLQKAIAELGAACGFSSLLTVSCKSFSVAQVWPFSETRYSASSSAAARRRGSSS